MSLQKTAEEIELIRSSALLVSKTLGMLAAEIKPGITTLELDKKARLKWQHQYGYLMANWSIFKAKEELALCLRCYGDSNQN